MTATGKRPSTQGGIVPTDRESTARTTERLKDRAEKLADRQRHRLVEQAQTIPSEAHKISNQLREDGHDTPAEFVETVADKADRALRYVDDTPLDQIARDVSRQARNNPAVYLGAAFGLGLASTRFLRAATDQPPGVRR